MDINRYVVVGGGTAGWISASLLAKKLKGDPTKTVTIIESPNIPIIGVGEGTVPSIRETLRKIGISERDLFVHCDATFKQSIKFTNWLDNSIHGKYNSYHHLFDYPFPFGDNLCPYWHNDQSSDFAEMVSIQQHTAESMRAPKDMVHREFEGVSDYAYHFDAHKFAVLLKRNAIDNLGIEYIQDNVTDVRLGTENLIEAIVLEQCGDKNFDFYVDCSGFSSILLGGSLEIPFIDKKDVIFSNRALTVQVPEEESVIPPYTISTAHKAGWVWDIALSRRRGVGFVFSDHFMAQDQAYQKLERYVGRSLDSLNVRAIKMKIGHRKKAWHKNCVAIGLSQGFVEPLEATAILISDFSANFLCNKLPHNTSELPVLEKRFNNAVIYTWERVIDFVKLHYCISDRQDSDFWIENRNTNSIPDSLLEKLSLWKHSYPTKDDFFSKFEVFDIENYLYILCGMKYGFTKRLLDPQAMDRYGEQVVKVLMAAKEQQKLLPDQRALLKKLKLHGFPSI
ncbi:tryptophan 7-halogenase [Pseudoalteromonas aurantia]|uniref:tryptophan halogenase family protein n=1 Tax=Pseudoalteromonas aurantia TaxID=43654 RepID=UPI00110C169B|nr:tryptophan halogenase family protein [Pseudoalteromonas aurantia]TMO59806.1 tryptophan 7-halogenase [Pseudoalteromonas aurantia]